MEKEGMGKKGQGLSITMIILIVLGIFILVLVVIGVTQGFDFFFGKFSLLPGQTLETFVQTCNIAGENNLVADYCKTFKEIEMSSGKKSFVNCQYNDVSNLIDSDKRLGDSVCGSETGNVRKYCEDVKADKIRDGKQFDPSKVNVNGRFCDEWGVSGVVEECEADLKGKLINGAAECGAQPPEGNFKNDYNILPRGTYLVDRGDERQLCCVLKTCGELNGDIITKTEQCTPPKGTKLESGKFRANPNDNIDDACCVPTRNKG